MYLFIYAWADAGYEIVKKIGVGEAIELDRLE
jgi:hypothetical protein